MIRWLAGRISRKPESSTIQPSDIRRLETRIQELERLLKETLREQQQAPASVPPPQQTSPPNIHIHTMHVHHATMDSLSFRLDALDIKELSGSLNLGNNFGTNMKKPSPAKSKTTPELHTNQREITESAEKRNNPPTRPERRFSRPELSSPSGTVPITSTASGFKISPVQKDNR